MPDKQFPLLPADLYLATMLWPDDEPSVAAEKYRWFRAEVESGIKIDPAQPQAGAALGIIAFASAVISVGLTIAASFFKPKQQEPGSGGVTSTDQQGSSIIVANRISPSVGFDSVQQPAVLGSTIPIIWAKRQTLPAQVDPPRPAGTYGGVRYNAPLIWSQLWTWRGSHLLRALFLLGEGRVGAPDPGGYAIGDNSLATYEIPDTGAREMVSRVTLYFNGSGGPIRSSHRILGRIPGQDVANNENYGGPSVFSIRDAGEVYRDDFCYVTKPSTSTTFGLYAPVSNGMAIRSLPRIRPTIRVTTRSVGDDGDFEVDCDDDPQALAEHWKARYHFSLRSGIVSIPNGENVDPGDTFTFRLDNRSDSDTKFIFDKSNTDISRQESRGEASCSDIANTVASKQRAMDESLVVGEVYKVGSCLAILVSRSPDEVPFISDADNEPVGDGISIEYLFRVIRGGRIDSVQGMDYMDPSWSGEDIRPPRWNRSSSFSSMEIPDRYKTASDFAQIFRCAIATLTFSRSVRIFEIGIKSSVGIQLSGYTNFRDCKSMVEINQGAGMNYQGQRFDKNEKIGVTNFFSGTVQRNETRVSLFAIEYRDSTVGGQWTRINQIWGIRGSSSQPILNYLRFEMTASRRWEIRFEPVSSYELRSNLGVASRVNIITGQSGNKNRTTVNDGIVVEWYGETKNRERKAFNLPWLDPQEDVGIPDADTDSFLDNWAMVAETFVYEQIQTSVQSGPEHEIVYVNTFSSNPVPPSYDNIATLGLNLFASREFSQLPQFSAYFTNGFFARRLLEPNLIDSTNLFPDVLRTYLSNTRFGVGGVVGDILIDLDSFTEAANWCQTRRYFYDAVDATKVNLLQWAADIAGFHLLELNDHGGKWALSKAVLFPNDGPVPVKCLFTAGNIVEKTFRLQFLPDKERRPIRCSVKWREERQKSDPNSSGFFPVEREVFVQEVGQSDSDPIESFDLTAFCTNVEHAIDVACYIIRMRRLVTHSISFSTTPDALSAGLAAGDYIKVAMELSYFDQFSHGIILDDGTILSTRGDIFTTGTHSVMAWDGVQDGVYQTQVIVDEDGKASPTGIVFAKQSSTSEVRTYKIEKISISEEGTVDIEAVHHPCDANGISEIGKNWTTYRTDQYWIIEGNEAELDFCTCPIVTGTPIPGNTLTVGPVVCNSGTATTLGIQWYRNNLPIPGQTNNTYVLTSQDSMQVLYAEITYQTVQGLIGTCKTYVQTDADETVVLLLHMDGEHNSTIMRDYSVYAHEAYIGSLNPVDPFESEFRIARNNSRFGGSSAAFSFGQDDPPTFTHPNAFAIGLTQDFTVEFWYHTSHNYGFVFTCFGIRCEHSLWNYSEVVFYMPGYGPSIFPPMYEWVHIAIVRKGGLVSCYLDGQLQTSGIAQYAANNTTCTIGACYGAHIDEFRATKGVARYDGPSFTPPTAPFEPGSDDERPRRSTLLLMHFNGIDGSTSFENESVYEIIEPFAPVGPGASDSCVISTAQSKFGGSSLRLSNTGGKVLRGRRMPKIYKNEFTIDFWMRADAKQGTIIEGIGEIRFFDFKLGYNYPSRFGGIWAQIEPPQINVSFSDWTHIAITLQGNTMRTFINGGLTSTTTVTRADLGGGNLWIGASPSYQNQGQPNDDKFYGYIDELRVVGNEAVWTTNFTPPTQPYIISGE